MILINNNNFNNHFKMEKTYKLIKAMNYNNLIKIIYFNKRIKIIKNKK